MTSDHTGGTQWELVTAGQQMIDARRANDPEAEVKAMIRFADGLRNSSVGVVGAVVLPLSEQIKELAEIVTNARHADLNWRTEERSTRDAQNTRLYEELDRLIAASGEAARGLGKLEARLDVDEQRLDSKRARIESLEADVATLKQNSARFDALEAAVKRLERGNGE